MKKAEEGGKEKGLTNGVKAERGREILEKPYPCEKSRTGEATKRVEHRNAENINSPKQL